MRSYSAFSRMFLIAAGLVCFASSPAAAECMASSESMSDPFVSYKGGSAIVHKDSGFVFPAEIAGFRRECEMTTDFSGNNFEIRYLKDIDANAVDVKISVVHLEELTARDHYLIVKPDVMSHYSSASTISEGDYFVSGRSDLDAYQGIFDGAFESTPWHFSLTAIDYGYWDARLTASYPQEIDEMAQEGLLELITAFQWQTPAAKE